MHAEVYRYSTVVGAYLCLTVKYFCVILTVHAAYRETCVQWNDSSKNIEKLLLYVTNFRPSTKYFVMMYASFSVYFFTCVSFFVKCRRKSRSRNPSVVFS